MPIPAGTTLKLSNYVKVKMIHMVSVKDVNQDAKNAV